VRRLAAEGLLAAVAVAVSLALPSAAGAGAGAGGPIIARSGNVRAELTYARKDSYGRAIGLHLRIVRQGQTFLDRRVPAANPHDGLVLPRKDLFQARDLDGDGEPEVLLALYTGGAHCCTYSLVWRYRPDLAGYGRTAHQWGNAGFRLVDLEGDGIPEFRSADDRFSYAFTAYAFSFEPIQVWRYRRGVFTDATRKYPKAVAADLASLKREYRRIRGRADLRGFWAAYAADSYSLRQGPAGWRAVRSALRRGELKAGPGDPWPSGTLYMTALRRYLVRLGYAPA
jgi:hypothetical protein